MREREIEREKLIDRLRERERERERESLIVLYSIILFYFTKLLRFF